MQQLKRRSAIVTGAFKGTVQRSPRRWRRPGVGGRQPCEQPGRGGARRASIVRHDGRALPWAAFLAPEASAWITGESLRVAGGLR